MATVSIEASQRRAARVAGIALLLGMAIVVFSEFAISSRLLVPGNAPDTARNLLAHETMFRVGLVCDLIYVTNVLVLLTALYTILKPVDRSIALAAACFRGVYMMMWVLMALNMLTALRFLEGAAYLRVFEMDRLQALSRLHLRMNFDAYYVGLPFFGLASTVCSYLWLKSGYIPRALSALGLIASAWCVLCAFAFLVFPHFNQVVNDWWFDTPLGVFELTLGVWLWVKGLRPPQVKDSGEAAI